MKAWSDIPRGAFGPGHPGSPLRASAAPPEAWEIEEVERVRAVREAEERERLEIPLGDYRQVPGRVPSGWERIDGDSG